MSSADMRQSSGWPTHDPMGNPSHRFLYRRGSLPLQVKATRYLARIPDPDGFIFADL
jgi:hypothetical protein